MNEKTCTKCGVTKPLTHEFWYVHPHGGWHSRCKDCMAKAARDHRVDVKNGTYNPNDTRGLDHAKVAAMKRTITERGKQIVQEFRAELEAGVYADVSPAEIIREFRNELASGVYGDE